jgi:CheY-like chemotaxis protein
MSVPRWRASRNNPGAASNAAVDALNRSCAVVTAAAIGDSAPDPTRAAPDRVFRHAYHYGKLDSASGFEAGIQAESFHPDCIITDFSIGKVEALQICQNLRKNVDFGETILIALLPDDGSPLSFDRSAINETFKKPFDAKLLAERLRTLIGARKELV